MAPTVNLRREIDREALMRPFCDTWEGFLYQLNAPFQEGSLTYATDSRRIIRAELTSPEIVGERMLPNCAKLWENHWRPAEFVPIERPAISELLVPRFENYGSTCPVCLGRRISLGKEYPDFDDEELNTRIHRLGYDVDDNSIRDESCNHCRGLDYYGPSEMQIGDFRFAYAMVSPMFALPELRVAAPVTVETPLLFVADGFEGMVMPLAEVRY